MNNFRPITSGLSDVYERVLDTEHRSVKSIWQDNVKYAIQWMPNGTIVLREHRQPFSSNKATRKITILTEWKRDSRGRIATLYLSMILSKRESDIDRNSFIVRRVEADWWASTDTGQSRMFESGWAKIYDTEAATVHNNSMLVTCASKSPAPSQNQGSTKQFTQAYETTRSVIFPNRRKGDLKMEIIYDRMGDKPVSKRIFAIHEDTDPDLNQHIIMTLQKESYLTPFRSDLSPSYTGELSISKFNCKDGKLCESYDLAGLVLVILLTDMGYPRRESARDGRF